MSVPLNCIDSGKGATPAATVQPVGYPMSEPGCPYQVVSAVRPQHVTPAAPEITSGYTTGGAPENNVEMQATVASAPAPPAPTAAVVFTPPEGYDADAEFEQVAPPLAYANVGGGDEGEPSRTAQECLRV